MNVWFKFPDGAEQRADLDFVPRYGEAVEVNGKQYRVLQVLHKFSEFAIDGMRSKHCVYLEEFKERKT